jgi:hypothetical protein
MIGYFERFLVVFIAALLTACIAYVLYRRKSAALWGHLSVWVMWFPMLIILMTGTKNTLVLDLLINTLGIPVMAALLAIADILLMEIAFVIKFRLIIRLLGNNFSNHLRVAGFISSLQKHNIIPKHEGMRVVFIVSVIGGLVNLTALFLAGAFF